MSVARGRDWGEIGPVPDGAVEARTDAEAAAMVAEARRADRPAPPVVLTGGDLARTLGGPGRSPAGAGLPPTATGVRARVDVGAALADGRLFWFAAHLVARRSWWAGRVLVVANAAFMGKANVAPRAHPGDGRLDVLDCRLPVTARVRARSRLESGAHVPHPGIEQRRAAAAQFDLDPPLDVYCDGRRRVRRVRALSVRVEPAVLEVWIPVPGAGPA